MNRSGVSRDVCTSVCCFCMDVFMCPFHWETKASYSAMTGVRVEIVLTTGSLDVFTYTVADLTEFHSSEVWRLHIKVRVVSSFMIGRWHSGKRRVFELLKGMWLCYQHVFILNFLSLGYALSMACTIAIRYSTVRRQGFTSSLA